MISQIYLKKTAVLTDSSFHYMNPIYNNEGSSLYLNISIKGLARMPVSLSLYS